jgi:plasmid stabilization system protein ParE
MKIIFTVEALADLDGILAFVATNHPTVSTALDRQIRTVLGRISAWPESAREVVDRRGFASLRSCDIRTEYFIASRMRAS